MTATLVSVILSNYNGEAIADVLRRSVGAVLQQSHPALELILVDDGSSDASPTLLQGLAGSDPRLRFVSTGRHQGIAAARNAGLALARGEHLAFIDNDAVPAPDWLSILVERLESDPTIGACASRVMFADKPDVVNSVGSVLNRQAHGMGVGMFELDEFLDLPAELMYATGNGMIVRRAALQATGPFDEGFRFYGHDDSDMGVRLRLCGYRIVPEPRAVLWHLHSFSKTQPGIRSWDDRNRLRFILKHYHWREMLRFALRDASQRLRAPGRAGYLWAWLSNLRDLPPLLPYRWAHRRAGPFLARQAPFQEGPHGYLVRPDNRGMGSGFPPLGVLQAGSGDEAHLYLGWYWPQPVGRDGLLMRWGRRVSAVSFSLTRETRGLDLELVTPPATGGGEVRALVRRQAADGWETAATVGWRLAPADYACQQLHCSQPLAPGNYRLILIAERAYREAGEFPRELGLGLISLKAR